LDACAIVGPELMLGLVDAGIEGRILKARLFAKKMCPFPHSPSYLCKCPRRTHQSLMDAQTARSPAGMDPTRHAATAANATTVEAERLVGVEVGVLGAVGVATRRC
jgi:hypothetical protein